MKYIPFIVIVSVALLIFTGFLVDEGGHLQARQMAATIARDAARTGVDAITGSTINGDAFHPSELAAVYAADQYVAASGNGTTGSARVDGDEVIVTVHTIYRTRFGSWVGIDQLDAVGIAGARLVDGN